MEEGLINPLFVWTSFNCAKRYSIVALFSEITFLSKTIGFESSEYPFFIVNNIGAINSVDSFVAKHLLNIACTFSSFKSIGLNPFSFYYSFIV